MARILGVHGIGQQFKGSAIIHRDWWPALRSGVQLAGVNLADEGELVCAFYGHLFRKPGSLSGTETYRPQDLGPDDVALLKLVWQAASQAEPDKVPSPAEYAGEEGLARWPQLIQRALNALSKSRFFANMSQALMVGDLKQVVRYMTEPDIHDAVLEIVLKEITAETRVVIGHSLGSVVAYEALCHAPNKVVSFITLGSPLGIRNLIFERLTPRPEPGGTGVWPAGIIHWTNIADVGDVVAMQRTLAPLFRDRVKDVLVYNGSDAHHGERYLTTIEAGEAIRDGLWAKES